MAEFASVRSPLTGRAPPLTRCQPNAVSSERSGASARAAALTARARALGDAQAEVHAMTMREISALAQAATRFFNALPLAEFSGMLLPSSARQARRMRHKVLHQVMLADYSGATLRALLLGRDGRIRVFSARSSLARDFMSALEPGQGFMAGIRRDVADWTPQLRIAEFRPGDVLDTLLTALDEVEQRLTVAERQVAAQREALAQGDLRRIRDSLGPSKRSPRALSSEPIRTAAMRLTPGPSQRAIRPPDHAGLVPAPAARPQLPAGAPVAPASGPSAPAPGGAGPIAASAVATPGTAPRPTAAGTPAPRAATPSGPATAPPPPRSGATPVPATPPVEAGWLSRAVRAAVRTPPQGSVLSDTSTSAADAPDAASPDSTAA